MSEPRVGMVVAICPKTLIGVRIASHSSGDPPTPLLKTIVRSALILRL
jgi:hypothetical protein